VGEEGEGGDEEDDGGDDEEGEDDVVLALLLLLLLSLLLSSSSLSSVKLPLSLSFSSFPPRSLSVSLPKRSMISLVVMLGGVFCPNPLGTLPPPTTMDISNSSSSNNDNVTETYRKFIDIVMHFLTSKEGFGKY